jgi:hypothetical protein
MKEAEIFISAPIGLYPPPGTSPKFFPENPYCMIGNAWQPAVLFTGAL